jgi:uncharacterized protein YcgL (UPF0745 family)
MRCSVYRSSKKELMYLYVDEETGLESVPEDLLSEFGEASLVLDLELTAEKKLAKEDIIVVMQHIKEHGYHLQMPPVV